MAKDALPSVSGAKLGDDILMGKDYYEDVERFLSRPTPSSAATRNGLPTLEKLRKERSKMKASIRKSREANVMNIGAHVSSKIDTGTRERKGKDDKPFDYGLVINVFLFFLS